MIVRPMDSHLSQLYIHSDTQESLGIPCLPSCVYIARIPTCVRNPSPVYLHPILPIEHGDPLSHSMSAVPPIQWDVGILCDSLSHRYHLISTVPPILQSQLDIGIIRDPLPIDTGMCLQSLQPYNHNGTLES